MNMLILIVFILGYIAIAFEHPIRVNKAASALITAVVCWTILILTAGNTDHTTEMLLGGLGEIASILFFLLGAMTIVELIDSHNGFDLITASIKTVSKPRLLTIITVITFFLSALLDNLTTAIVMVSLSGKLLAEKEDRLYFAGMIIIAANAGGAWSPLGDVTTTMLWIGKQITAMNIIRQLFLPSVAVCLLPLAILLYRFRGQKLPQRAHVSECSARERREGKIILFCGIGFLLFVPAFKTITHLPPFMGMLFALGVMWVLITLIHRDKTEHQAQQYAVSTALQKIDTPSILFFLGILLAVSALEGAGMLKQLAVVLTAHLPADHQVGIALGLLSALVDNVPLVAAAQGMYDLGTYPTDHHFWEFLALTTGTGGSAIIIGSAAGVAAMGIEQIGFGWYLKRISLLALLGFASGIAVFYLQSHLFS